MLEFDDQGLPVSQLKLGMYISRLDIPWEKTDFPLQGLLIQTLSDIDRVSFYCKRVYIDQQKSRPELQLQPHHIANRQEKQAPRRKPKAKNLINWKKQHCVESYTVVTPIKKEVKKSLLILDSIEAQVSHLCENTLHCRKPDIDALVESTSKIVESVIRNPDALAWLCRIRDTRKPVYMHTIRLAVWGGIVGRQLGLNKFALSHLCSVLLMTGIGKSHIPENNLLAYRPCKPSVEYQKHLHETLYQLAQIRFGSSDIIDTLKDYCERLDGSGYPARKRGDEISFLAKICGLIETFELLINPFDCSRAVSAANAVVYLNKCKGVKFDVSIVEEFIKAIGIYPTGSLVEFSDGQKGIIFSQSYDKRLRASVIPILNAHGNIINKYQILDLAYTNKSKGLDEPVFIRKGLPSSNIPRGLLENAHNWMFHNKGSVKSILHKFF